MIQYGRHRSLALWTNRCHPIKVCLAASAIVFSFIFLSGRVIGVVTSNLVTCVFAVGIIPTQSNPSYGGLEASTDPAPVYDGLCPAAPQPGLGCSVRAPVDGKSRITPSFNGSCLCQPVASCLFWSPAKLERRCCSNACSKLSMILPILSS